MNSDREPRLDALLKEWQPRVDLPRRFESEVWHRIALAQERRARWFDFDALLRIICPPKFAFAIVAAAVLLGTVSADLQARQNFKHQMENAKSRYIYSVDPFAHSLLSSNP